MRSRVVALAAGLALLTFAASAYAGGLSKADKAANDAGNEAFRQAMLAGDAAALAAMYTEDAVLMPPNAPAAKGRDAIEKHFGLLPPLSNMSMELISVEAHGDVASFAGHWKMTLDLPDGPVDDSGYFLDTRVKQKDGSWLISLDMYHSEHPVPSGHDHDHDHEEHPHGG